MTPGAWNWLLTIVGTIASIAGVVFSWMAWVQAAKAKEAAREAADAVRTRNLSHDFSRSSRNAQELLQAVRELRFENAQRAATDLLGVLAHNKGWQTGFRKADPSPK
jgi:predicted tellurium resistance membrane protein TerC